MAMHHFLTSNDSLKTRKWKNSVTPVTWNGPFHISGTNLLTKKFNEIDPLDMWLASRMFELKDTF